MNRWRILVLIVCLSAVATPASAHLVSAAGRPKCGCRQGSHHSRWRPPVYLWLVGAAVMLGLTGDDVEEASPLPAVPAPTHLPSTVSVPAAPVAGSRVPTTAQTPPVATITIPPTPAAGHQPPALPPAIAVSAPPRGLLAPLTASPLPLFVFVGAVLCLSGAVLLSKERSKRRRAAQTGRWRRTLA